MDDEELRHLVLDVIQRHALEQGAFNSKRILDDVESYCRQNRIPLDDQALLTFFYDLFRNGYPSWGLNLNNPDPPWCHLTSQGRAALAHFSRDPANPDGYLAYLAFVATLSRLAKSYIEEALQTFNARGFKAAAVMIGVASESLALDVRDTSAAKMNSLQHIISQNLSRWMIKRVLDGIHSTLRSKTNVMPTELAEAFDAYWPAMTQQIRTIRNDAGHPKTIAPVQEEAVHAGL
jgi:hypothetical protein